MKKILSFTLCILLHLTQVCGEEASSSSSSSSSSSRAAEAVSSPEDLSRAKRAVDMRRLARGIQMLRLGKRSLPLLRLGKRPFPDDDNFLQNLVASLENQYYDEDFPVFVEEPLHPRYRRSAEPSQESAADGDAKDGSSTNVKRSVGYLDEPVDEFGDEEGYMGGEAELEKRPMSMLRLGKRPVNMLRLGKRPMSMLRLGKRPMSMLRLGKRPMSMLRLGKREDDDEELMDSDTFFGPSMDDGEGLSADKRPMSMLRLGKRPMSMLRLGKRPMSMLRLGKRPMSMLRLGKRQVPMLRLGKRSAE